MRCRPYKIAVAGAHSTGKSSFLERLRADLECRGAKVECVHSSAAEAQALGFPILSAHTIESTAWMMAQTIKLETTASLRAEVILVDRPILDALGYLLAALKRTGRTADLGRLERLCAICSAWSSEYDVMFVTSIDSSIPLGDGRDSDAEFRSLAAESIAQIAGKMFPGRHILDSENVASSVALGIEAFEKWRREC